MFLVSLFNYLDRFVLGILLPRIGAEMRLSDAQLGFINGGALSLFYVFAGIPIGRLADNTSRRIVLSVSLITWSAMTAACGLAQSFGQLVIARLLVGIGQSGATAPANGLIADLFEARRRTMAISIYAQGLPAGILVGFMLGGVLADQISWRYVLICFGLPGIVLGGLLLALIPERQAAPRASSPGAREPMLGVVRRLLRKKAFVHSCLGSAFFTVVWLSLLSWLPTMFARKFALGLGEIGWKLALVLGFSQMIGLFVGGLAGDRLSRRDPRWLLWIGAAASALAAPFIVVALASADPDVAFLALVPAFMVGLVQGAPALAAVQAIVGPEARALGTSIYLAIVNIVSGLGSQAVGILSDALKPGAGALSLSYALIGAALTGCLLSALHFLAGARTIRADQVDGLV